VAQLMSSGDPLLDYPEFCYGALMSRESVQVAISSDPSRFERMTADV